MSRKRKATLACVAALLGLVYFLPIVLSMHALVWNRSATFDGQKVLLPFPWISPDANLSHIIKVGPTLFSGVGSEIEIEKLGRNPSSDLAKDRTFWLLSHGGRDNKLIPDDQFKSISLESSVLCRQALSRLNGRMTVSCIASNSRYTIELVGDRNDLQELRQIVNQISLICRTTK